MSYEKQLQAERLLLYGLLDQAEQLYSQVLEEEPRNSEAAFGLARVALERGDEQLAHARAARAVELNPRNDDAQRLLARLTEVIQTRRQPPQQSTPQREPTVSRSERAAVARNPSMADHRARERQQHERSDE